MVEPFVGVIETGVPMAPSKRGDGRLRAQMERLQVGASFETEYSRNACYRMAKRLGIRVNCRPSGHMIRVWRVE